MVKYSLPLLAAMVVTTPIAAQTPAPVLAAGETLLQVQSVGRARIEPDVARITFGIVATGVDALSATNAASGDMAKVVAALRAKGVAAADVQTLQINVEPRFERSGPNDYQGQARITGYVARNSANVTIRRLTTASDMIAAVFGAGANSVQGPEFYRQSGDAGTAEARRDAIDTARREAQDYADGFGLKIVRVLRVSERANETSSIRYVASRVAPPPPPPPQVSVPISAGTLMRETTLWVDFALAPR